MGDFEGVALGVFGGVGGPDLRGFDFHFLRGCFLRGSTPPGRFFSSRKFLGSIDVQGSSFCGISGDLAPSTRKSLAIAILRFWCTKYIV